MPRYLMTPEQIDLVRKSFDALWPFRRKLAERFYSRFFELAPDTRRLFPNDMERQQLKLMDTIAAIVGTLDQRETFQSIITHTGRKHADFGVQASHCGNDRKPADLNSEEAAVRSQNVAATQNFLDRLRDAGHDPDEVFASSVGGGDQPPRGR
jgi:hypothetical protein